MFSVSYHKSFIFLVITIGNTLSVVSRLYVSYKLISFELDENQACLINVVIGAGIACLGVDTRGAQEPLFWMMLSTSGPGPPSNGGGLQAFRWSCQSCPYSTARYLVWPTEINK